VTKRRKSCPSTRCALEQVLKNLLQNALQLARRKPIETSVAVERGELVIAIRDHGAGLPAGDQQPNLRSVSPPPRPGHRAWLGGRPRIVELHGGKIRGGKTMRTGARVQLSIPA